MSRGPAFPGRAFLGRAWRAAQHEVRHRHDLSEPVLALTFDDGPSPWTEPILDALREARCRATFFVLGEAIAGRESILIRMRDEGHEIGNHSRTHPHLDRLQPREIRAELTSTSRTIKAVLGQPPRVCRPPYLDGGPKVNIAARLCRLKYVVHGWTVNDWLLESGDEIARRVLDNVRPGSIAILHDGRSTGETSAESREDREPTVEAVKLLLPELRQRGFELVTVSELLAR